VIVRERPDSFVLVEQHHHGLVSGEFARHWAAQIPVREAALYAIENHDVGWRELDETVRWNDETGRPYSFLDYPAGPKLRAYANGLDHVQAQQPLRGVPVQHALRVLRAGRAERARGLLREAEAAAPARHRGDALGEEIGSLEYNFRLLQLCDDLSLFVCLNEPGRNDYPHYRDGFGFMGTRLQPVWEDERRCGLDPNPFSEDFGIEVPYLIVGKDRRSLGNGILELRVPC
jgi:hypothetical protein